MGRTLAALSGVAALLAVSVWSSPDAHAEKVLARSDAVFAEGVLAQFDPRARQTRVSGRASSDECFFFTLPQEWQATADGAETRLTASSGADLVLTLRSSHELRGLSQKDLALRDATLLQQAYENRLGRPAQSVTFDLLTAQTTRWSATWIDASLPSGRMTVETFIVPLSDDWVLELSFENVETKETYETLVRSLLTGLKLREGGGCRERLTF